MQLLLMGRQNSTARAACLPPGCCAFEKCYGTRNTRGSRWPNSRVVSAGIPSRSAASFITFSAAPSATICGESALLKRNRCWPAATWRLPRSHWLADFLIRAISQLHFANLRVCLPTAIARTSRASSRRFSCRRNRLRFRRQNRISGHYHA